MSDVALDHQVIPAARGAMDTQPHVAGKLVFLLVLLAGAGFVAFSVASDIEGVGGETIASGAFLMLGLALLIALGFEFVNGFHDTANAVATVIYTHSLPPMVAVVWSGMWNLIGVVLSSGLVAYSIITLLPVELILQVGSGAGYAMIFALLIAAIIWNLGTWSFGIPNSSSHALVGSIMGVGIANQLMAPDGANTSGVDWSQAASVFEALAFSPICGFVLSALLLLLFKMVIKNKKLYEAPEGTKPPPGWIRGMLILTCTGVSFFHGGNDGQKGMGLIMLILIGAAPTAYALNRALPDSQTPAFIALAQSAQTAFAAHADNNEPADADAARNRIGVALRAKQVNTPEVFGALSVLAGDIGQQVKDHGSLRQVPAAATGNVRNDMYLSSDAIRVLGGGISAFTAEQQTTIKSFAGALNAGTRFIPFWVKLSVAIALGLGTMVGWKRIVVTVGEKIGKTHLTYAQGASAEIVAMATIGLAEGYGMPVSTTHILSSGVAGTMAANGSGIQWSTLRSMALAWIMTLPAAMLIAGVLYFIFRQLF
jgi:PiT family inorganic phosphate transporter